MRAKTVGRVSAVVAVFLFLILYKIFKKETFNTIKSTARNLFKKEDGSNLI